MNMQGAVLHFDGTLYNTDLLRWEMIHQGINCPPGTDPDILLQAWHCWGEDCVNYLDGMFSFVIREDADDITSRLFLARDAMGVKPLFYAETPDGLAYASSLKLLIASLGTAPVIKKEGIYELLLLGPGRTPGSAVFDGIRALQPGECAVYTPKMGLHIKKYFQFEAAPHIHSFEETTATVKTLLAGSIKAQSQGGGKSICSFLSGGLDSSAIAALSGVRDTFSVDYADNSKYFTPDAFQPEGDDTYISEMTAALGTRHTKITIEAEELAAALSEAVTARGLPGMADVDASMLLFSRRVRDRAEIALSGEGADELFGGYPWYRDETRLWEDAFPWSRDIAYRRQFLLPELRISDDCEDFVRSRYEKAIKLTEDGVKAVTGSTGDEARLERRMRQMFLLNVNWFGQTLLERHNSMSVYAGLEARVPFCDRHLAAYAYNIPWRFKNYKGREKGLLREAMKGIIPDKVLWRKKSPYPKTHNPRYLEIASAMLNEVLQDSDAPLFKIVDRKAVKELLNGEETGQRWYGQLMTRPQTIAYFWQINEWMKQFGVRVQV
jgi:asparagine synthase (glutamine-hydrolysing)